MGTAAQNPPPQGYHGDHPSGGSQHFAPWRLSDISEDDCLAVLDEQILLLESSTEMRQPGQTRPRSRRAAVLRFRESITSLNPLEPALTGGHLGQQTSQQVLVANWTDAGRGIASALTSESHRSRRWSSVGLSGAWNVAGLARWNCLASSSGRVMRRNELLPVEAVGFFGAIRHDEDRLSCPPMCTRGAGCGRRPLCASLVPRPKRKANDQDLLSRGASNVVAVNAPPVTTVLPTRGRFSHLDMVILPGIGRLR